jgi:hypothetical protein
MIYRFTVCSFLGSLGLLLLLATALSNQMASFSRRRPAANSFWAGGIRALLSGRPAIVIFALLVLSAMGFLWPGLVQWTTTGAVTMHWSRLLAGAFCLLSAFQIGVFLVMMKVVELWLSERRPNLSASLSDRKPRSTLSEDAETSRTPDPVETVGAV